MGRSLKRATKRLEVKMNGYLSAIKSSKTGGKEYTKPGAMDHH